MASFSTDSEQMTTDTTGTSIDWPVNRVRSTFINYFQDKRSHVFWPSSPVVPVNDPTLLFANAGMNQFKPLFLGTCDPALEMSRLKMAVNSQKCIRAGGKHNDLEDVGKDVYHHTFFEMLGNWSFGSYFKEEAITWAWDCLTNVYGINPDRIYATYFGGDASQGLAEDSEAKEIWSRFLPAARILPFGCKDNFWEMGATGPCGPCTEIHYDRIGGRDAAALVNADKPDVIEIWNNVFIQFNREADGSLRELPSKHVDTGMGLERLTSILQDKSSNYDTDIFMPIFKAIQRVAGCRPYSGLVGIDDTDLIDTAYRIISDHIRTLTFAITDGAIPSNDGRGYVLRRILRRAVRYGQEILHAPEGFFTSLVPIVIEKFSAAYPELMLRKEFVMLVIADEEKSFNRTLDQGVKYFKKVVATMESSGVAVVPAKEAHVLFSSMGFPLDLTELMAAECGFTVDTDGFNQMMESDRKISEAAEIARKGGVSKDMSMAAEQTSWLHDHDITATDSEGKYLWDQTPSAKIVALYLGRGCQTAGFVESLESDAEVTVAVVTDASPFYYESGGQTYDTGCISGSNSSAQFVVDNVQAYAGFVVHVGRVTTGSVAVGDAVTMSVDYERRRRIAPNHTMTHVLNHALKHVLLGKLAPEAAAALQGQCEQKGSLVDADKLRFDFSWNGPLSKAEIEQVEVMVNEKIHQSLPVFAEVVPLSDAKSIYGLRQVFGEKYPDPVRVISVGESIETLISDPSRPSWAELSIEFCGGTHIKNTSEAEYFVLAEETGIAKGIRRIIGLTRNAAKDARLVANALLAKLDDLSSVPAGPDLSSISKAFQFEIDGSFVSLVDKEKMRASHRLIQDKLKAWYKSNLAERVALAKAKADSMAIASRDNNEKSIIGRFDFGADGKVAKKIQDSMRAINPSANIFIASLDEESDIPKVFVYVSSVAGIVAKEWLDSCFAAVGGGKGGGKGDQANGSIEGGEEVVNSLLLAASRFLETQSA